MGILPWPKNPYLCPRDTHFLALFFNLIVILHSVSVLSIQNSNLCSVHRQMADLVAFLATCLTSQLLFWLFLIEVFGFRPLFASGEAVPCEVILANEIGWKVSQGGETFWGVFL